MTNPRTEVPAPDSKSVYAWYVVTVCMIAYTVSFIDRQVLAMLIQPIKADLHINDTEFGLLHGLAFTLFYATMGLPIAQLSDRRSRPLIIAIGIFFWSLSTVACGFARSFWHLFAARMGVGAGEASLSPATYSLISDLFPREKLGRAVGFYSMGSFLGAGLAFILGGSVIALVTSGAWIFPGLDDLKPWQVMFVIVGLPGILLALIIQLTIRDPGRKTSSGAIDTSENSSFIDFLAFLKRNRRLCSIHIIGYSCSAATLFSLLGWSPAYLIRNFHMTAPESGFWLGLIVMIGCTGGVLCSGALMDFLMKRGYLDAPFRTGIIGALGVIAPLALLPATTNIDTALTLLAVAFFFAAFPMPPSTAFMQLVAPNRMRSRLSALFLFCNSLLGLAAGSAAVGMLTDYFYKNPAKVGNSMAIVAGAGAILTVVILLSGMRALHNHLAKAA